MTFSFRDNIENMHGYVPGFQPDSAEVIKINTNENPYPPSAKVVAAIKAGVDDPLKLQRYPNAMWKDFRAAAAKLHGVEPEQIVGGNGGDELLTMLVRCCCEADRALAYPVLTYSLYPVLGQIQNCPVIEVPFNEDGSIPTELASTEAGLTILCNPNAPTGNFVAVEQVAELAGKIDGVLLVDEAYVDFAEDNCVRLLGEFENLAILRSLSKGYSLAGIRFGYVMASRRIVEAMVKVKDSYNVNALTQAAATAAIQDQAYFKQNVAKIVAERARLTGELRRLGYDVPDSQSNFILVTVGDPAAKQLYDKLQGENIFVRYWEQGELRDKLRISIGTPEQNDALLEVIGK